jgi:hypothetical protein
MAESPRVQEPVPVQLARVEGKVDNLTSVVTDMREATRGYTLESSLTDLRHKVEQMWNERNRIYGALLLLTVISGALIAHFEKWV